MKDFKQIQGEHKFFNEHAQYKRGLCSPEKGVRKINSHPHEVLSLYH